MQYPVYRFQVQSDMAQQKKKGTVVSYAANVWNIDWYTDHFQMARYI